MSFKVVVACEMSRKRRCWCKHSVGFCVFPRRITWTTLLPRRYPSNAPSSLISHFPIMPHFPEKLTSGTPRAAASKEPSHPQCQNTIATLNAMSKLPKFDSLFPTDKTERAFPPLYSHDRDELLRYARFKTAIPARFQEGKNLLAQNQQPRSFERG